MDAIDKGKWPKAHPVHLVGHTHWTPAFNAKAKYKMYHQGREQMQLVMSPGV